MTLALKAGPNTTHMNTATFDSSVVKEKSVCTRGNLGSNHSPCLKVNHAAEMIHFT